MNQTVDFEQTEPTQQTEPSQKGLFGKVLRATFGGFSLIGAILSLPSVLSLITHYSDIKLRGIVAVLLSTYRKLFHDGITSFIDWLNISFQLPFKLPTMPVVAIDYVLFMIIFTGIMFRTIMIYTKTVDNPRPDTRYKPPQIYFAMTFFIAMLVAILLLGWYNNAIGVRQFEYEWPISATIGGLMLAYFLGLIIYALMKKRIELTALMFMAYSLVLQVISVGILVCVTIILSTYS